MLSISPTWKALSSATPLWVLGWTSSAQTGRAKRPRRRPARAAIRRKAALIGLPPDAGSRPRLSRRPGSPGGPGGQPRIAPGEELQPLYSDSADASILPAYDSPEHG